MTRVDFYLIEKPPATRERVACRLVEKAFRQGLRCYIAAADEPEARRLDDLLWTFAAHAFVPHALAETGHALAEIGEGGEPLPVVIGWGEPPAELHEVLIQLSAEIPAGFSRFERVAEVVGPDEESKARARERYRFYRDRGYPLETHPL